MDFDKILYIVNMDRGGLYRIEKCMDHSSGIETRFNLICMAGQGLDPGSEYMEYVSDVSIYNLITKYLYVPVFSEKEALFWKLKYAE